MPDTIILILPSDEVDVLVKIRCAKRAKASTMATAAVVSKERAELFWTQLKLRRVTLTNLLSLNGVAGTGKATITRTITARFFADGRLGAFLCSRDFEDQLVRLDPEIVYQSLFSQIRKLIVSKSPAFQP